MRGTLLATLVFLAAAVSGAGADDYIIGAGDLLKIDVWGVPAMSGDMVVRPDGKVTLPALGDIAVEGLKPQEVAARMNTALEGYVKQPQTTVTVKTVTNNKIYLAGEGVQNRAVTVPGKATLFRLLVEAAVLEKADLENAFLIRGGKEIARDFRALLLGGAIERDVPLKAEDIIFIPGSAKNRVFVVGAVNSPKTIPFRDSLSALDALLEGGGFSEQADRESLLLVRRSGEIKRIPIGEILGGKDIKENALLQPGDYVVAENLNDKRIYVSGEANSPQSIAFAPDLRILDAIYTSGGFTKFADTSRVILFRKGEEKRLLDLGEIEDGKSIEQNILLRPGDHIVITESLF